MPIASQMKADHVICLASWEPRFLEGVTEELKRINPSTCIIFYLKEFIELTKENIQSLRCFCAENNIASAEIELSYDKPLQIRRIIQDTLNEIELNSHVLVDISTMTREVIWQVLAVLEELDASVNYIYWRAQSLATWTSKNSRQPRLVVGRSGISEYGRPTLVAVTTGYDRSRLDQMTSYFEPETTILFVQNGDQYENEEFNIEKHKNYNLGEGPVIEYPINSYACDHGFQLMSEVLSQYESSHNIVLASFGPKPSAIAFHRYQLLNPVAALAYTPSIDFNRKYSEGIGEPVFGKLI